MDFESALTQELKTISTLGNRVYPLTAPEANAKGGVPYLIYVSSEGERLKSLGEGYLEGKEVRAEINVMADRYKDMKEITKQVVALLVGMEQRVIGTNGPFIQELTYNPPVELYEDKPQLYRCVIEFNTFFEG
ncbi:tail completion protein gp17 [Cohnella cholangitidis]|uniref:DUF3168 domain-containing protein n=1 Tax=Cohnella cholangitidis TaxID=2598458 RepID=A0A7G5C5I3_9BACL|nr:DUF3168 domain-containing protein [Cohnella cholangitidis]QMV44467.1 DUF3168 domain-containing protein [Cohnella cholangitidis]